MSRTLVNGAIDNEHVFDPLQVCQSDSIELEGRSWVGRAPFME